MVLLKGRVMKVFSVIVTVFFLALVSMAVWRWSDHLADKIMWQQLAAGQPETPALFNQEMLEGLPAPAQRYFRFSISEGTPLYTVAEISMHGQFSLGSKQTPNYMNMSARQILAAPNGFVWKMRASRGVMRISGSDSGEWTRFWLMEFIPVARMGGDQDHARAAYGRYVAEALFWTPAALLPGPNVVWQEVDDNTARATITRGDLQQAVDVTVDEEGRPIIVSFQRWSNANPDKIFRLQPFGGTLSEFREFEGFYLPTHIEAGNNFGTEDYFPFYVVDVIDIRFADVGKEE
jgi:Family of unknown function (DUF6544)